MIVLHYSDFKIVMLIGWYFNLDESAMHGRAHRDVSLKGAGL